MDRIGSLIAICLLLVLFNLWPSTAVHPAGPMSRPGEDYAWVFRVNYDLTVNVSATVTVHPPNTWTSESLNIGGCFGLTATDHTTGNSLATSSQSGSGSHNYMIYFPIGEQDGYEFSVRFLCPDLVETLTNGFLLEWDWGSGPYSLTHSVEVVLPHGYEVKSLTSAAANVSYSAFRSLDGVWALNFTGASPSLGYFDWKLYALSTIAQTTSTLTTSVFVNHHSVHVLGASHDRVPIVLTVSFRGVDTENDFLVIAILNSISSPTGFSYAAGTVLNSLPYLCRTWPGVLVTGQSGNSVTACFTEPKVERGTEEVTFDVELNSTGVHHLVAASQVIDINGKTLGKSYNYSDFEVQVVPTLMLTIGARYEIGWILDSIQHFGNTTLSVKAGIHFVAVPEIVPINSGKRLRFHGWSDGGKLPWRYDDLDTNKTLFAIYVAQYNMTLNVNPSSQVSGDGWYDEGAAANISSFTPPSSGGILGFLGPKWVFGGWYDGKILVSSNSSTLIIMTQPRTLAAHWSEDYTMPSLVIGLILLTISTLVVFKVRYRIRN